MIKNVKLTYVAHLKEIRGLKEETVKTAAVTAEELYSEVKRKYPFNASVDLIRVSINDRIVPWATPLHEDDHVVFIPPVSGG